MQNVEENVTKNKFQSKGMKNLKKMKEKSLQKKKIASKLRERQTNKCR